MINDLLTCTKVDRVTRAQFDSAFIFFVRYILNCTYSERVTYLYTYLVYDWTSPLYNGTKCHYHSIFPTYILFVLMLIIQKKKTCFLPSGHSKLSLYEVVRYFDKNNICIISKECIFKNCILDFQ